MNRTLPRYQPRSRTEGQLNFLIDLVKQIAVYDRERGVVLWNELRDEDNAGQLTMSRASEAIEALKVERNELRVAKMTVKAAPEEPKLPLLVPEGRYAVDTDEGHLAFYQVKVNKQGEVSLHLQTSDELRKLPFKTAMAVMAKIEAAGIQEAMIRYGKELRICGAPMCGRTLTNKESRERGIGPKCATKMGW
jgi:hypothetical protein